MKVGQFEAVQMLEGARNFPSLNRNEKNLLFKIIDFLMRKEEVFELDEDEVHPAYDFICQRISHCTMERDMTSHRFNPKTYEHLLLLKDAIRYHRPYTIVEMYLIGEIWR